MTDELTNYHKIYPRGTMFLTVLCILTFIGSGWELVNNSIGYFLVENSRRASVAGVVAAFLCLIGAVLMWQLRKTGFYIYLTGILVGIIIPLVLYRGNLAAMGISAITSFFGVLFVVLYGVNLKYMK